MFCMWGSDRYGKVGWYFLHKSMYGMYALYGIMVWWQRWAARFMWSDLGTARYQEILFKDLDIISVNET